MAKKDTWSSAHAKPGNEVLSFHDDKFNACWKRDSCSRVGYQNGVCACSSAVVVKTMKLLSWMFKCLEQSRLCCKKACLTPSLQELVLSLSLEVSSHRRVDEAKQAKLGLELWEASAFSRKLLL
ncbi:hypothetical protein MUK42_33193 [Musa troglodytarum]|uniref:Uncharacterized protein n=1 Tax=Musa troglodytarum TaxID=320322 RepID=A0A9E7F6E7_9LILI|nr:hypothetical protein MUK42_33193 [Musa troglodytarum]